MPHCDLIAINRVPRLGARRALVPLAVAALLTLAPEAAAQFLAADAKLVMRMRVRAEA